MLFFMLTGVAVRSARAAAKRFARNVRVARIDRRERPHGPRRSRMSGPGAAILRGHETHVMQEATQRAVVLLHLTLELDSQIVKGRWVECSMDARDRNGWK